MSIRKRTWMTSTGQAEAWIFDYRDMDGKRRHKHFKRKQDAVDYANRTGVQIREGTHVPDNASVTVHEAGKLWLQSAENAGLEPTTIQMYQQHLDIHIKPFIGRVKLSRLSIKSVRDFEDQLHKAPHIVRGKPAKRSAQMVHGVMGSLGSILADAHERGLVGKNVVSEMRRNRRGKKHHQARRKRKLQVGVDIPTPDEVRTILNTATGRLRPLLMTAVLTGLRASELRGLRWEDVDLKKGELHVRQRADRNNRTGQPKSRAGTRTVPMVPQLVTALREWKLVCPMNADGKHGLVFPTGKGKVETLGNIVRRGLIPCVIKAGLTKPLRDEHGVAKRDEHGKPMVEAKYKGMHCLRHFFASWCINRKEDGGMGLPAKVVQERLGHATIAMTMDTYGHLFPRGDDTAELAAGAERLLFG